MPSRPDIELAQLHRSVEAELFELDGLDRSRDRRGPFGWIIFVFCTEANIAVATTLLS